MLYVLHLYIKKYVTINKNGNTDAILFFIFGGFCVILRCKCAPTDCTVMYITLFHTKPFLISQKCEMVGSPSVLSF